MRGLFLNKYQSLIVFIKTVSIFHYLGFKVCPVVNHVNIRMLSPCLHSSAVTFSRQFKSFKQAFLETVPTFLVSYSVFFHFMKRHVISFSECVITTNKDIFLSIPKGKNSWNIFLLTHFGTEFQVSITPLVSSNNHRPEEITESEKFQT